MNLYYILNLSSGLVAWSPNYLSAINYAKLCGGVVIRDDAPAADSLISKCRAIWNA